MSTVSCRKKFLEEATARWGPVCADEMRESLEKTAEAVETVNSYPLNPEDEPNSERKDSL